MITDVVLASCNPIDVGLAPLGALDVYIFTGALTPTYVDAWVQDTMNLWLSDDGLVWAGVQ